MSNQRCPNCGNEVPDGAQHCPYCGQPFGNSYNMVPGDAPQYPNQPQQPYPGYPQQPYPNPPKNNNNKPLLITLIAVLVVLVIAVIIGIFIFVSKGDEKVVDSVVTNTVVADTIATTTPAPAAPLPPVEKPAPKRYASDYDYVVTGSVGKYGIYMEISISGRSIYGRYKYNRVKSNAPSSWLTLSGTVSGDNFVMTESDYNGEFTGSFEGTYSLSGDHLSMRGNMYNQQGKTFNFKVSGNSSL